MSATSGLDSTRCQNILGAISGKATLTAWGGTTGHLKLITPSGTTNESFDGTEVSGGSYPAGGISYTVSSTFGSASYSSGVTSITNSAAISQSSMPAATVAYIAIYDNTGTPLRWWWAQLTTSVTTNSGDTLTFAASSITLQINM